MSKIALQGENLSVRLGRAEIVSGANLSIRAGELSVLLGPNGAGKTTLVRALAGLLPCSGAIRVGERPLSSLTANERARRIAYLPQGNVFHWPLCVREIVRLGRYPYADPFSPATEADRLAVENAMATTATQTLAVRDVTTLSGGERARVALARALATQSPILLADEPTVSLDARHQLIVMRLLREIARGGSAVLAVIHDLPLAARFADNVIVMREGRIVAQGAPPDILTRSRIAEIFGIETITIELDGCAMPFPDRPL